MDINKKWMASGLIGCTFAALFAKDPFSVGWKTIEDARYIKFKVPNDDTLILSLQFPNWNKSDVMKWAINNGFYLEQIDKNNSGLRLKIGDNVSWVQYFGPDSHVLTRQSPLSELMLCVKLPKKYYWRVGFNGILHLAHASISKLTDRKSDKAWFTSFSKTKKLLGNSPNISQAAKTTFNHE